jgi:cytochrome c-type protein NapC
MQPLAQERQPTRKKLLSVTAITFLLGLAAAGALGAVLAYTNSTEFCVSCHSQRIPYAEYKQSPHYKNSAGVSVSCADCHVPKELGPLLVAKVTAWPHVYAELVGTIDTREKFEARRWALASEVWQRMKATKSRECLTCHQYASMEAGKQSLSARIKHRKAQAEGRDCIDCHKGVAHKEPWEPDEPGKD